ARAGRRRRGARPRTRPARRAGVPGSSVAGGADHAGLDAVLRDELPSELELVGGRLPGDAVDLGLWPPGLLWRAVAVEAPLHEQRLLLPDEGHLVDRSVAGGAADALVHVGTVVEVHEVGKVVDLHPGERRAVAPARTHGLERRAVLEDLRVAVHAGLGGRDPGDRRLVDARVAVAAVDPHAAHVVHVVEGHGLRARLPLARHVGRARPDEEERAQDRCGHDAAHDQRGPGEVVSLSRENLGHVLATVLARSSRATGSWSLL